MKPSIFRALTEIEHNLFQECSKAGLEAAGREAGSDTVQF
jgi:hypothetical protein